MDVCICRIVFLYVENKSNLEIILFHKVSFITVKTKIHREKLVYLIPRLTYFLS